MDILFCTSEAYPLVKTGGLADVSGSLPKALRDLGNDVRVVLPAYPAALANAGDLTAVAILALPGASEPVRILTRAHPRGPPRRRCRAVLPGRLPRAFPP